MATLVLSYAGSALGGLVGGPFGAALGRAAGAIAGNLIDQQLFGGSARRAEGPRLKDLRVMTSTEGAAIPKVWGRMRVAGQVIWATNFEEVISTQTEKAGGKGAGGGAKTKVTTYSYFANFAVGLAEGPIVRIGRVWADGKPLELEDLTLRFYGGNETQNPDSLIAAKEGAGNAPAYRGLAYAVFERLPLERFGNRLPQLSFEIFRPVGKAAEAITAVNIIPGATEFGYDTDVVTREPAEGETASENAHASAGRSDWQVSIDDLQATCPNLQSAALVVAWFGNDLRCGSCTLKPGVEVAVKSTSPHGWLVDGVPRSAAHLVSEVNGGPAYGGTPADASVVRALQDLQARGLRTVFYPFILMDVPQGNARPDPYTGAAGQPAYPWRGRMTCSIAPGRAGTPDKTAALTPEINAFIGTAQPSDFAVSGTAVTYTGPAEWSYRRMILHYAHLCAAAGGVSSFLIGSELRGLTRLRNTATAFPFVTALINLAADVAAILPAAKISYAADWTEYFGYQPQDGSNDLFFNLDPLWASPDIDFIGIDNYMPLSDWREGTAHLDRLAGAPSIYDLAYLKSNVAGGEGYDWFYASEADRRTQTRDPIADAAYGKPWVFRYKDVKNWWTNQHVDRPGGIEQGTPTAWVPQSKPIRFTEAGCPAVDKATNQPNVFIDPKSAESALPHFSNGGRDDYLMHRYVEVLTGYWQEAGPHNPLSTVYGGRMVDTANTHFWAWDARPFPAFPALGKVWADGGNYARGHWLNGRIGAAPIGDLVAAIAADYGFGNVDAGGVTGLADGLAIERVGSARDAIEPLARAWTFDAVESEGVIRCVSRARGVDLALAHDDLVDEDGGPLFDLVRSEETGLPARLKLAYAEASLDYRTAIVEAQARTARTAREAGVEVPCALEQGEAAKRAEIMLQEIWADRETIAFRLAPSRLALEPGDIVSLDTNVSTLRIRIEEIADGAFRRVRGRLHDESTYEAVNAVPRQATLDERPVFGRPLVRPMSLSLAGRTRRGEASWIACFSRPWPGSLNLFRKSGDAAFTLERTIDAPAVIGELIDPLAEGPIAVFDRANRPRVRLYGGALASVSESEMLGGANAAAVGSEASGFEIIQFRDAVLTGPKTYELAHLLRGQSGSEPEMKPLLAAGAEFILLDPAVVQMNEELSDLGSRIVWRVGPANRDHGDRAYVEFTQDAKALGLRPYRPAQLRARRDGGDIVFAWVRRTRIDGDGWQTANVPLGETSQAYEIDIVSGATVLRTATVTTPSYRYPAADQIADFGSSPSIVTVRVHQMSEEFGRGPPREGTFNV